MENRALELPKGLNSCSSVHAITLNIFLLSDLGGITRTNANDQEIFVASVSSFDVDAKGSCTSISDEIMFKKLGVWRHVLLNCNILVNNTVL